MTGSGFQFHYPEASSSTIPVMLEVFAMLVIKSVNDCRHGKSSDNCLKSDHFERENGLMCSSRFCNCSLESGKGYCGSVCLQLVQVKLETLI